MSCIDRYRDEVIKKMMQNPLMMWRDEVTSETIEELRQIYAPETRKRLWHTEFMVWFWLTSGFYREKSFNAVTEELWIPLCAEIRGLEDLKVKPQRMTEGRARIPAEMLREIRKELAKKGVQEGKEFGLWRGRRVLWVDGSSVTMPDEPQLKEYFGCSTNQNGNSSFPIARIVNLGIAGTRIVLGSNYGPYRTSENELTVPLLEELQPGDLLVGDRLFSSMEIIVRASEKKADAVFRKHAWLKVGKHKNREIGQQDWLVEVKTSYKARKKYNKLPKTVEVRVFHIVVGHSGSRTDLWITTTLLDPQKYPKEELAKLYLNRWGIETSYAEIKTELHMKELRSKTVDGAKREIESHLATYNYVRLQMLRAAKKEGLNPIDLSFTTAVRVIIKIGQLMRDSDQRNIKKLFELMLRQIAAAKIQKRPGRHEPRLARHRRSSFKTLKTSRKQWRQLHDLTS